MKKLIDNNLKNSLQSQIRTDSLTTYRKLDDSQVNPITKDVEIVKHPREIKSTVKRYNPNLPITITFIWKDRKITIANEEKVNLWKWKPPTQEFSVEYDMLLFLIRGQNEWYDPDNVN